MAAATIARQPWGQITPPDPEVRMSVPPRPAERDPADWEVAGERPTRSTPQSTSDKAGLVLVALVTVAVVVALVLLIVL